MITATVSEKGWIVIPKELRDKYGIKKGKKVGILEGETAGPSAGLWGTHIGIVKHC